MKKIFKLLFSRLFFGVIFIILQVGVMVATLYYFRDNYAHVQTVFTAISVITVLYIINQDGSSAFKIAWILPIVFLPLFGIPLYILFGKKRIPDRKIERLSGMYLRYKNAMAPYVERHAASTLEMRTRPCSPRISKIRGLAGLHADGDHILPPWGRHVPRDA